MIGAVFLKGSFDLSRSPSGQLREAHCSRYPGPFRIEFRSNGLDSCLVGAVIGVIVVERFKEWAFIALAALVGALLTVRGLQMLVPFVQESLGHCWDWFWQV